MDVAGTAIETEEDVIAAVRQKPEDEHTRSLILKKSIDLGCVQHIPDDWVFDVWDIEPVTKEDDNGGK